MTDDQDLEKRIKHIEDAIYLLMQVIETSLIIDADEHRTDLNLLDDLMRCWELNHE